MVLKTRVARISGKAERPAKFLEFFLHIWNCNEIVKRGNADLLPTLMREVEDKIAVIRNQEVIADADVAYLYGVETREVNQAVRNNPRKFREGYVLELTKEESTALRSNLLTLEHTNGKGRVCRHP